MEEVNAEGRPEYPLASILGWSRATEGQLVPSHLGTILTESKSHLETVQVINTEYEFCSLSKGTQINQVIVNGHGV